MNPNHPITLLWSLRSLCDLACPSCYFGDPLIHQIKPPTKTGQLSHISPHDLKRREVLAFARTLKDSAVGRIFIAGGEPLNWPGILDTLKIIKDAGIEVIVCTNGIPLNRPVLLQSLLDLGIDAFSISLDSTEAEFNDWMRPDPKGKHGWQDVVDGIRALIAARNEDGPRVGLYTVITRRNIEQVPAMGRFAAELGADYYVPQPIALPDDHPHHEQLSLRPDDTGALTDAFAELYAADLSLTLPEGSYPGQVIAGVPRTTSSVAGCFGGRTLHFIQPDGAIWDCVSSLRIDATPVSAHRTIRGHSAADLFPAPTGCASDCPLASYECVNMWPLMGFDRILTTTARSSA
ncbi:radical SAM protein [Streptomyces sp. NPDC018711]|uniref:radical SAM protein n=1 Tax=Streptomyces sp. NPDC018711 TaxID=3365052 RepID=UPI0037942625